MVKNGISKLVVVLVAVLMTFLASEAAWAGMGSNLNKTVVTIEGTVTAVSRDTCSITVDAETVVEGIGPESYWIEQGIDLPAVDEYVIIKAYTCLEDKLVAIEVTICTDASQTSCETIILRDEYYLPLWRGGAQTGQ